MIQKIREALYPYKDYISWSGTAVLLISAALTSLDIYPLNILLSLGGNMLWALIGWVWKEKSLVVVSLGLNAIYLIGLAIKFIL